MDSDNLQKIINNQSDIKDLLKNINKSLAYIFQLFVVTFIIWIVSLVS
jgi:hypothetical protein